MHYYVLFKLLVTIKKLSIVGDLWEDNNKFVMPMKCKELTLKFPQGDMDDTSEV
jgi:hypothetical protein